MFSMSNAVRPISSPLMPPPRTPDEHTSVAALLRSIRATTRISQFELALRLGVSQRHVSFIEKDRARPGRHLLIAWLGELGASHSVTNAALVLAGFAPKHSDATERAMAMAVDPALERTITLHDPNPAFIFDADWRIVALNAGGEWLCHLLMPDAQMRMPIDMLQVLADPEGWLSLAVDPVPAAVSLLRQLRAEQWLRPTLGLRVDDLESALQRLYGPLPIKAQVPGERVSTLFEVSLRTSIGQMSFTAVQTLSGLPQDALGGRHRAELWFPADSATSQSLRAQRRA